VLARLREIGSPEGVVQAAKQLLDFAKHRRADIREGKGPTLPAVTVWFRIKGRDVSVFEVGEFSEGKGVFSINFDYLHYLRNKNKLPSHVITQLYETLCKIPEIKREYENIDLKRQDFNKRHGLSLEILTQQEALDKVLQALDDLIKWDGRD
jgi:hypothetical protein